MSNDLVLNEVGLFQNMQTGKMYASVQDYLLGIEAPGNVSEPDEWELPPACGLEPELCESCQ